MKNEKKLECNLRTILTYLAIVVLLLNVVGFFVGFISVNPSLILEKKPGKASNAPIDPKPYTVFSNIPATDLYTTKKPIPLVGKDAPCKLVDRRSRDDGRWFNYSTSSAFVYAYSAFYDNRTTLYSDPVIRVIVLAPNDKFYPSLPNYRCRLHVRIGENKSGGAGENKSDGAGENKSDGAGEIAEKIVDVPMLEAKPIGMGWPINGAVLREYLFTCVPPNNLEVPTGVGILVNKEDEDDVTSCVPVERPVMHDVKEEVGICVQVAYGTLNAYHLVEWLEIQRLIGATYIGVYNMDLDPDTLSVLRHYVRLGLVDLRQSHYIPHGAQQYMLFGSPVINDCFYRNMYRFRRVLVIDFDELVLPRMQRTYKDMFEELDRNHGSDVPNYLFRNQYFFTDMFPKPDGLKSLKFSALKMAAPLSRFGYSAKSAVRPETCVQMHNHFCWQHTPAYAKLQLTDALPSLATNQHYRSCHLGPSTCRQLYAQSAPDDAIGPYVHALAAAMNETIERIVRSTPVDPFAKWKIIETGPHTSTVFSPIT